MTRRFATKAITALAAVLLGAASLHADEGMWMVNAIDKPLEKKMKAAGCKMTPGAIYNEQDGAIADAVVSMSFFGTGSMISPEGLMITNHHCAYADIFRLSTPEKNYLEDGFWARSREEEIPVEGAAMYFLRQTLDITDEVKAEMAKTDPDKPMSGRKLSHTIETRYEKLYPGKEVSLYSMYGGQKHYLGVYDVYKDVRLVAAPPVCIGAFGADIDNWEWPQHKGDFAIYRIYDSDGKPLKPRKFLKVSTKGIQEGDFVMTLGYPGITHRGISSEEMRHISEYDYPVRAALQRERMDIIKGWMEKDPAVRLKYSDIFFNLSNGQEIREGAAQWMKKRQVVQRVAEREKYVPASVTDSLKAMYGRSRDILLQRIYYQCCCAQSGGLFKLCMMYTGQKDRSAEAAKYLETLDLRVEKDIFCLNIKETRSLIDSRFWGKGLTELFEKYPGDDAGEKIWASSLLSKENPLEGLSAEDPVVKAITSMRMVKFNKEKDAAEAPSNPVKLSREYRKAIYEHNLETGAAQYPDANSSMRLSYGNVASLTPCNAILKESHSTVEGVMEKYNPEDYDFSLKPDLAALYGKGDWGRWAAKDGRLWVNFISTNDITGGNSGSPVLNARGELVGLAFDGNKEGLTCDWWYDRELNRTVCVDIRFVLWVLEKYAHADNILNEILN